MRFALLNPNWNFDGSIYFGCREPHLPLEFGYAADLLQESGHEALLVDGQLENLSNAEILDRLKSWAPDFLVLTTAPSYLFWRCAPPELRVPQQILADLRSLDCAKVIVGPHGSTSPQTTLRKLRADIVVLGEFEEILPKLTGSWTNVSSICYWAGNTPWTQGAPHASDMTRLKALHWPADYVQRHLHHHHRFDASPLGPGAEVEASRGCPYHCTFCAKENFRTNYRRRPVATVLEEIDGLLAVGVEYIYFIDEIFLPNKELLEGLLGRSLKYGVQTRIDLWQQPMIDLLAASGCVSIEAGVESISESGREALDKKCRLSTQELADRLIYAKARIPFVQANLIQVEDDDPAAVEAWRTQVRSHGVWANEPVPLFPYPGSPDYTARWGSPDELAWERAHAYYLEQFEKFSDVQNDHPASLPELEHEYADPGQ